MTQSVNPELDLTISRVIKAPRSDNWNAWTARANFEQWWVPAPAKCKVLEMDLRPGGSLVTRISEDGGEYSPHLSACFLAVDKLERIVFTNCLVGGWRPAENPLMTATLRCATIPRAPTTSPTSCTRTTPIETCTKSWASTMGGAPSSSNLPSSSSASPNGEPPAFVSDAGIVN